MAIHLHDNGDERQQHQLPFDGKIDWPAVMKEVAMTGYRGATSLEPMNWDMKIYLSRNFLVVHTKKQGNWKQ